MDNGKRLPVCKALLHFNTSKDEQVLVKVGAVSYTHLDVYKRQKGHHIVPSAPMVIKDDPTLMFTNAGMNQFKDIILEMCIRDSRS